MEGLGDLPRTRQEEVVRRCGGYPFGGARRTVDASPGTPCSQLDHLYDLHHFDRADTLHLTPANAARPSRSP